MSTQHTDRELLELAAKAAGLPVGHEDGRYFWCEHGTRGAGMYCIHGNTPLYWNPLTDDGDALRLAVVLKIDIHQRVSEPRVAAVAAMHSPQIERVPNESQRLALTRRAIVRAAAAIGEKMP